MLTPKRKLMTLEVFKRYWNLENWHDIYTTAVDPTTGKEYELSEYMDFETLERYLVRVLGVDTSPMITFNHHYHFHVGEMRYIEHGNTLEFSLSFQVERRSYNGRLPRGWAIETYFQKHLTPLNNRLTATTPFVMVNKDSLTIGFRCEDTSKLFKATKQTWAVMLFALLIAMGCDWDWVNGRMKGK